MHNQIRIGTRESQLAMWQAVRVRDLLTKHGFDCTLVPIKSEGDLDLKTPLYEMGVQGIFTRSLDLALLNNRIDIAVHSLKDVPTQMPPGIMQAAVLERGPVNDLLVFKNITIMERYASIKPDSPFTVATSSIRRKAQWLHRYPSHEVASLRGNVNTRLEKISRENWDAAIFAQAGLERINIRPKESVVLDWMLPAPAQGAIVVVARDDDQFVQDACALFNHESTAVCTQIERDFLRTLLGGCSTPISALAVEANGIIQFKGNIFSLDGTEKVEIEKEVVKSAARNLGNDAATELLKKGGQMITDKIRNAAI